MDGSLQGESSQVPYLLSSLDDHVSFNDDKNELHVDSLKVDPKAQYLLAQLEENQLRSEIELETQQRLLKASYKVKLAQLQLELSERHNDAGSNASDTIKFGKFVNKYPDENVFVKPNESRSTTECKIVDRIDFPKVELQYFDGNPRDYWRFIRQFENYIESRVLDEGQRLLYLLYYCKGEAKDAIAECCMLPNDQGYNRSRNILKELYGESHIVARSLIDDLLRSLRP
ncbi:MAG: DUF1759 domain-containing protein, partial [Aeromonas sp.]